MKVPTQDEIEADLQRIPKLFEDSKLNFPPPGLLPETVQEAWEMIHAGATCVRGESEESCSYPEEAVKMTDWWRRLNIPYYSNPNLFRYLADLGLDCIDGAIVSLVMSYQKKVDEPGYPSNQTVARLLGINKKTVIAHKKKMVAMGYLRVVQRRRGKEHDTSLWDFSRLIWALVYAVRDRMAKKERQTVV